jgi:hypothetical protein
MLPRQELQIDVIALDGGRTVLVQLGSGWAARSGQPAEFSPAGLAVPLMNRALL